MKRYLGFALAMFFAIVAIALVGGDSGAIAGHGCHGGRKCHGGLFANHHANKCHGGLLAKHRAKKAARCHGEEAVACDSGCGEAASCGDCGSCGGEAVASEGCSSCGGEVSGGCAGGDCSGAGCDLRGRADRGCSGCPRGPCGPGEDLIPFAGNLAAVCRPRGTISSADRDGSE